MIAGKWVARRCSASIYNPSGANFQRVRACSDARVEKSNKAEAEEAGSGQKWLTAILISCAVLFVGATSVILYMFVEFTGCPTNNAFISLTLIFGILLTTAQMTGDEGSLLSSASISAWAAFLCYTAVSKNPDDNCNPRIGEPSPLSIAFGLFVTIISLCWTGWSYTAEDKLTYKTANDEEAATSSSPVEETKDEEGKPRRAVTGVVTTGTDEYGPMHEGGTSDEDAKNNKANNDLDPSKLSNSWRLNIALAAVSCWSAMFLTEWGQIQSNGTIANPSVGRVSMWMIIGQS
jgi:serine incorporator 1/3